MKAAFLIDVPYDSVTELEQRVEDSVNAVGGRLIYRMLSRDPIFFVRSESPKYPPSHTPSEASGRVVNHASQGNVGQRLDRYDHRGRRPFRRSRGFVSHVDLASKLVQERHGVERSRNGPCDVASDYHCGRFAPAYRVRVHANGRGRKSLRSEASPLERKQASPISGRLNLLPAVKP